MAPDLDRAPELFVWRPHLRANPCYSSSVSAMEKYMRSDQERRPLIGRLTVEGNNGRHLVEPPILTGENGDSLVRKVTVELAAQRPAVVTIEIMPVDVVAAMDEARLRLETADGDEVEMIRLASGREIHFNRSRTVSIPDIASQDAVPRRGGR